MDIQVKKNSTDITTDVVSYTTGKQICSGVGVATFVLQGSTVHSFVTYDIMTLYEEGDKKGEYYVLEIQRDVPSNTISVVCQDASRLIIDYFNAEQMEVGNALTYTKYWIEQILDKVGVSYSIDASGDGTVVQNDSVFGMTMAIDDLTRLLSMSGWYFRADKNNVIHIDKMSTGGGVDATFRGTQILSITTNKTDKMLRNRAVVWGRANPATGTFIFSDKSVNTKWNYGARDKRAVVLANGLIKYQSTADYMAGQLLTEFTKPNYEKTVIVAGAFDIDIGSVVFIKHKTFSGTCLVTSCMREMSADGLKTTLVLDERCPRLLGVFDYGGNVYIGTESNGVWKKNVQYTHTWSNFSTGLSSLNVTDMDIQNGVFACVAGGKLNVRDDADTTWTTFEPDSLVTPSGATIPNTGLVCTACSIDPVTNIIYASYVEKDTLGFDSMGNYVPDNYVTIPNSWVVGVISTDTTSYTSKSITQETQSTYGVYDIEHDGVDLMVSGLDGTSIITNTDYVLETAVAGSTCSPDLGYINNKNPLNINTFSDGGYGYTTLVLQGLADGTYSHIVQYSGGVYYFRKYLSHTAYAPVEAEITCTYGSPSYTRFLWDRPGVVLGYHTVSGNIEVREYDFNTETVSDVIVSYSSSYGYPLNVASDGSFICVVTNNQVEVGNCGHYPTHHYHVYTQDFVYLQCNYITQEVVTGTLISGFKYMSGTYCYTGSQYSNGTQHLPDDFWPSCSRIRIENSVDNVVGAWIDGGQIIYYANPGFPDSSIYDVASLNTFSIDVHTGYVSTSVEEYPIMVTILPDGYPPPIGFLKITDDYGFNTTLGVYIEAEYRELNTTPYTLGPYFMASLSSRFASRSRYFINPVLSSKTLYDYIFVAYNTLDEDWDVDTEPAINSGTGYNDYLPGDNYAALTVISGKYKNLLLKGSYLGAYMYTLEGGLEVKHGVCNWNGKNLCLQLDDVTGYLLAYDFNTFKTYYCDFSGTWNYMFDSIEDRNFTPYLFGRRIKLQWGGIGEWWVPATSDEYTIDLGGGYNVMRYNGLTDFFDEIDTTTTVTKVETSKSGPIIAFGGKDLPGGMDSGFMSIGDIPLVGEFNDVLLIAGPANKFISDTRNLKIYSGSVNKGLIYMATPSLPGLTWIDYDNTPQTGIGGLQFTFNSTELTSGLSGANHVEVSRKAIVPYTFVSTWDEVTDTSRFFQRDGGDTESITVDEFGAFSTTFNEYSAGYSLPASKINVIRLYEDI